LNESVPNPFPLPAHFKKEEKVLQEAGCTSWPLIAALSDQQLDQLSRRGGALERQLRKLRGQAQLVVELDLEPYQAALLLYAGIASSRGLAQSSPQQLITQLGRLERSLTGMAPARVQPSDVRAWISRAQQHLSRSMK
jgi:hypothetical protein